MPRPLAKKEWKRRRKKMGNGKMTKKTRVVLSLLETCGGLTRTSKHQQNRIGTEQAQPSIMIRGTLKRRPPQVECYDVQHLGQKPIRKDKIRQGEKKKRK